MTDGAALLATMVHSFKAMGVWGERGTNMLDTGAPFYDVYECSDGEYVSIGSIEPQFYAELMRITGLGDSGPAAPAHPRRVARHEGEGRRRVRHQDPRRVVRADGGHRRLLRAGAVHRRSRRPSLTMRNGRRSSRSPG